MSANSEGNTPSLADSPRKFDWIEYYRNKSNQTPRDTLVKALEFFSGENRSGENLFAIDIGCGHGADTIELLKQGWNVYAMDGDENGISILNDSVDETLKKHLRTGQAAFENIVLEKCDLLNASYCLPFCNPNHFNSLWGKISNSVVSGGRFSGQFFGMKDSWSVNTNMTFHSEDEVRNFFKDFMIEYFDERDEDGTTAIGESKHWHVYSVIARKL